MRAAISKAICQKAVSSLALTTRYKRVMMEKAGRAHGGDALRPSSAVKLEDGLASTVKDAPERRAKHAQKDDRRWIAQQRALARHRCFRESRSLCAGHAHLQTWRADQFCKGGLKDLTKSEDDALREEASASREKRKDTEYKGVLGPGRDFLRH